MLMSFQILISDLMFNTYYIEKAFNTYFLIEILWSILNVWRRHGDNDLLCADEDAKMDSGVNLSEAWNRDDAHVLQNLDLLPRVTEFQAAPSLIPWCPKEIIWATYVM